MGLHPKSLGSHPRPKTVLNHWATGAAHGFHALLTKNIISGHLGGSVVEHVPLAQGVIPDPGIESRMRLPAWSLLLPLPMSLPLSVSLMNK